MRTPSSVYCGTDYRCHSLLSQSPPATTSEELFGLFALVAITRPSTLVALWLFTVLTARLDCAWSSMGSSCGRPLLDLWRLALMISADTSKGMRRILSWMLSCAHHARWRISHQTSSPLGVTHPATYLHSGLYLHALFAFLPTKIHGAVILVLRFRTGPVQESHSGRQTQFPPFPVRFHREGNRCHGREELWLQRMLKTLYECWIWISTHSDQGCKMPGLLCS